MTVYLPLTPGWVDYEVFTTTMQWHDDTMHLDILSQAPVPVDQNGFQRITRIPCGGITAFTFGKGGVATSTIVPSATLYNGEDAAGVGEYINNVDTGMVQVPGILELQTSPTPGHEVSGTSQIFDCQNGIWRAFPYPWRNRVIALGPWATWSDTVRSGLRETTGGAYNYIHARGIGAVDFWWGTPTATVFNGYRFYATAWSGQ